MGVHIQYMVWPRSALLALLERSWDEFKKEEKKGFPPLPPPPTAAPSHLGDPDEDEGSWSGQGLGRDHPTDGLCVMKLGVCYASPAKRRSSSHPESTVHGLG